MDKTAGLRFFVANFSQLFLTDLATDLATVPIVRLNSPHEGVSQQVFASVEYERATSKKQLFFCFIKVYRFHSS